jgi:hypothetical protein
MNEKFNMKDERFMTALGNVRKISFAFFILLKEDFKHSRRI